MNRMRIAAVVGCVVAGATTTAGAQPGEKSGLAALDSNSDGAISRQEAAEAQVEAFQRMDSDDNEKVDIDEFVASQPSLTDRTGSGAAARRARARALEQRFANLDSDNSGDIALGEYQSAMTPYFDRLDANGDGSIDGHELRRAYNTGDRPRAQADR